MIDEGEYRVREYGICNRLSKTLILYMQVGLILYTLTIISGNLDKNKVLDYAFIVFLVRNLYAYTSVWVCDKLNLTTFCYKLLDVLLSYIFFLLFRLLSFYSEIYVCLIYIVFGFIGYFIFSLYAIWRFRS